MRKIDKKHNIAKVNLLAEQRYLESRGLISESLQEVDDNHDSVTPVNEYGQSNQYDLSNQANMDSLVTIIASYLSGEKTNNKAVANDNKVIIFNDLIKNILGRVPASSFNYAGNANQIYTNDETAMMEYLRKIGEDPSKYEFIKA